MNMTSLPTPEALARQQFKAWAAVYIDGQSARSAAWEAWSAAHRLYAPALPEPTEGGVNG